MAFPCSRTSPHPVQVPSPHHSVHDRCAPSQQCMAEPLLLFTCPAQFLSLMYSACPSPLPPTPSHHLCLSQRAVQIPQFSCVGQPLFMVQCKIVCVELRSHDVSLADLKLTILHCFWIVNVHVTVGAGDRWSLFRKLTLGIRCTPFKQRLVTDSETVSFHMNLILKQTARLFFKELAQTYLQF